MMFKIALFLCGFELVNLFDNAVIEQAYYIGEIMKVFKAVMLFLLPMVYYPILSAQSAATGDADVVVLVDTSGTVLQYYEDINKRVLTEIMKKFVRKGDSVHILSFNADARYEMSQKINGEADLSRVVSRFLLLYQLGRNSDFLTGLKYCMQYTSNLASKKERILVVISDGIFNPPETSPYKNYGADRIKNEISLLSASIRQNGWKVYYVKLPFPADAIIKDLDGSIYAQDRKAGTNGGTHSNTSEAVASSESGARNGGTGGRSESSKTEYTDISKTFTEDTGITASDLPEDKNESLEIKEDDATLPSVTFPEELEAVGRKLAFPIEISNGTDKTANLKLTGLILDNGMSLDRLPVNGLETEIHPGKKAVIKVQARLPKEYTSGRYKVILRLEFENDKRVLPQTVGVPLAVYPVVWDRLTGKLTVRHITAGIILLLLLLMFLLFFLLRRRNRPNPSLKLKAKTVKPSAVTHNISTPEYTAWNNTAMSAGSNPGQGIQTQKAQADTAAFVMQNQKPATAFYPQEEKRYPKWLSEEENHLEKLRNFGAKNSNRPPAVYPKGQKKEYSVDNLSAFAAQTREDQALRIKMLTASLFVHKPRSGTMLPANRFEKIEIKANRSGMTEIYVLHQNRNIGKRNIHRMKPGTSLSVGGSSRDDFLIFLVPFPARIAEVRYDGREYHLAILKPKFFPYETANIVHNCVEKPITAVSSKGYHIYFTFREYEDPTEKLNGLLTSIQYDG